MNFFNELVEARMYAMRLERGERTARRNRK